MVAYHTRGRDTCMPPYKNISKRFFFKPEISISKKRKSEILKSADLGKHFFIIFKEYAIEFLLK